MMIEHFGALILGVFVGYVLGIGLARSAAPLRAALSVVGAALGAAPIAFLGSTPLRWIYPIGLLIGMAFRPAAEKEDFSARYALGSLLLVVGIFAAVGTAVSPATVTLVGSATAPIAGKIEVHYETPFEWAPNLRVACADCMVKEQRPDSFVVERQPGGTITFSWSATGVPRR